MKRERRLPASSTPEEILAGHTPGVQRIAQRLRHLVKDVVPEAREVAYPGWHAIGYRHPQAGYFCGIFPQEQSARLLFEWGVLLHDPEGLLRPGGKQVRFLEIGDAEAIPEDAIARLLLEAVSVKTRG